jgi:hypothetical protein
VSFALGLFCDEVNDFVCERVFACEVAGGPCCAEGDESWAQDVEVWDEGFDLVGDVFEFFGFEWFVGVEDFYVWEEFLGVA